MKTALNMKKASKRTTSNRKTTPNMKTTSYRQYHIKSAKSKIPNQNYETKPTKLNLPNETYENKQENQTKPRLSTSKVVPNSSYLLNLNLSHWVTFAYEDEIQSTAHKHVRDEKKKKIVEFFTKRLTRRPLVEKKRKMIYSPWNKFCMIWVLWHLSDGLSREL